MPAAEVRLRCADECAFQYATQFISGGSTDDTKFTHHENLRKV